MREIIIGVAALSGLGTAGYVGGAFDSGEYYEMTPEDVSKKLSYMTLPDQMGDVGELSIRRTAAGPTQVKWDILANGYSFAEIDAFLAPSGSGTRINVEFAMLDGPEAEELARVLPMDDEFLGEVIEMALTEQIDATLEGRPFDDKKLAAKMVGYVAANPGAVAKFQNSVASNMNDQLREIEAAEAEGSFYDDSAGEEPAPSESFDDGGDDWGN